MYSDVWNIYIFVCIINIKVLHEVKHQRVIDNMISQIMKCGQDVIIQNEQMYNIQMGSDTRFSGYSEHA